jgi:hypothetical protein
VVAGRSHPGGVGPMLRARALYMRDVLAWRDVRVVLTLFCAAQLLDGVTTYVALSSHNFTEQNPLLGGMLDAYPAAALVLKVVVAALVVATILACRLRWRMRLTVMALFAVASIAAPIINLLRLTGVA